MYNLGLTSCTQAAAWSATNNNATIGPIPGLNTTACFSNMAPKRNSHHFYCSVLYLRVLKSNTKAPVALHVPYYGAL
jgi:hypothetical protein